MQERESSDIMEEYFSYLKNISFPCIAARAALARQQIKCLVVDHMGCPKDDHDILQFIYNFVDGYRNSKKSFHSAAIIFRKPEILNEIMFDELLWQRIQSLADLDAKKYPYDKRVDDDPSSRNFSFSLKEEAFFIIGLHPASSRSTRQFRYPALAFNPHAEFEKLRENNSYTNMKKIVRKRDRKFSGSVNPMLADFGDSSEVYQYSGRNYDDNWQCPLKITHAKIKDNSST